MNVGAGKRILTDSRIEGGYMSASIYNRKTLRRAIMLKHGSITKAANELQITYQGLSDTIGGRRETIGVIKAIQSDIELTDEQVLNLWPLLRSWPRETN